MTSGKSGSKYLTRMHTVHTYEYLHSAAHYAYVDADDAKEDGGEPYEDSDRFIYCIQSIIFCGLTLEAYLNHLALLRFLELWEGLEILRPQGKLDLIAKEIGFTIDKGRRPLQTFGDIFRSRNWLAHGKTHRATKPVQASGQEEEPLYEGPDWMNFATLENAERCLRDTRVMIVELHKAAGIKTAPLGSYGASVPSPP